jgi:hypothetical protein
MMYETKTWKVFSLTGDFPPELVKILRKKGGENTYVEYVAMTKETEEKDGWDSDPISHLLILLGAEDEELVLINLDY